MERQNINHEIENFISEMKREIHHPILKRDAWQIEIDKKKIFFLLLPLLNGEKWTQEMNVAAIAVVTLHLAFDAHDVIDQSDATSRQQQLTVLSGDYYSAIHYKLLASIPNFNLVRQLSERIGAINEVKADLYGNGPSTSDQLVAALRMIESGCMIEFFDAFNLSRYAPIAQAALPLLRLDPLSDNEGLPSSDQPLHKNFEWESDSAIMKYSVQELRTEVSDIVNNAGFIAPFLKDEIQKITMPLLGKLI